MPWQPSPWLSDPHLRHAAVELPRIFASVVDRPADSGRPLLASPLAIRFHEEPGAEPAGLSPAGLGPRVGIEPASPSWFQRSAQRRSSPTVASNSCSEPCSSGPSKSTLTDPLVSDCLASLLGGMPNEEAVVSSFGKCARPTHARVQRFDISDRQGPAGPSVGRGVGHDEGIPGSRLLLHSVFLPRC